MLQIVIPAFNEEARLPRTLRALARHADRIAGLTGRIEVVVVDNASTDRTAEVARSASSSSLPVRVVHCEVPGKGAAVRAGMLATSADVVAFMDADGATDLAAIADAWRILDRGADVAAGSRAVAGSETSARHSRLRGLGALAYRRCTAWIVPDVADTQCGFKMMRGDLARDLFAAVRSRGFSFDVELLARADRAGAEVVEFPVVWTDVPGSTFDPVRHGAGAFMSLAAIALRLHLSRPRPLVAARAAATIPAAAAVIASEQPR